MFFKEHFDKNEMFLMNLVQFHKNLHPAAEKRVTEREETVSLTIYEIIYKFKI